VSNMIQCDCCGKNMYADSRSEKGAYHEIWIDRSNFYHLCKTCYDRFLKLFFPETLKFMVEEEGYETSIL